MEGKEARFGIANSAIWATTTTAASNGSVNSMHDSFTPCWASLVPDVDVIQLGEVIFGGVGSGLYGMLMFVVVAVFVAGLMVGRTPEYLGKKIEPFEMKMASIAVLVPCAFILVAAAVGVILPDGQAGASNPGAHGFSQILYAFSSATGNNGSAFARKLSTPIRRSTTRRWHRALHVLRPVLDHHPSPRAPGRIARVQEGDVPVTSGTLPTHTPVFVAMLICGGGDRRAALTLVPALAARPQSSNISSSLPRPASNRCSRKARSRRESRKNSNRAMSKVSATRSLFDPAIVRGAIVSALAKLSPREQIRNPVMFVVFVVSVLTTVLWVHALIGTGEAPASFIGWISLWLWFTLLFANFAEAMAEGRGKAQAASLRKTRRDVMAKKLAAPKRNAPQTLVASETLRKGDIVLVEPGDVIPGDGEVIEGVASVNESAITGESAPVIRESGGDRSAVTGGTTVLSDWIVVQIAANPGETFLDRMIALVEGAKRQKTPNEIALDILLAKLTIIFLLACVTLLPYSLYAVKSAGSGTPVTVTVLVALLVCLIPTTIGGLLSAIRIAGMDRLVQANVIATSGRAVEAAGDVDVLLLDKTGTITLGNRQASQFIPVDAATPEELADAAQLSSLADETPEGRSIVILAKQKYGLRERDIHKIGATFTPFSAQTRMSGVDLADRQIRKGSADAIEAYVTRMGGRPSEQARPPSPKYPRAARPWSSPMAGGRSASSTSRTSSRAGSPIVSPRCAAWASRP